MGYIEGWVQTAFKKNASDQTVFYPLGILGSGYVLPDNAAEEKAREILRRHFQIGIFLTVIAVSLACFYIFLPKPPYSLKIVTWLSVFLLLLPGLWAYVCLKALVAKIPPEEKRLTAKEAYANSAVRHNFWGLWFSFVFSIIWTFLALLFAIYAHTFKFMLLGWLGVVIFLFSAVVNGYMLKVKDANMKRKSNDKYD
jgi:hypothetical protein